jgi:hypothetical protein
MEIEGRIYWDKFLKRRKGIIYGSFKSNDLSFSP